MTRAELPERLETERLILRVRTVADAEAIHAYASLPEVSYPAGFPPVQTLEDEIYYLEHILPERNQKDNLPAGYRIVVKGTDTIIGSVDFNHRHGDDVLKLGYTLHPDYWGRGYVPEAARALIDLAFKELNLHKIELAWLVLATMSKVNESLRSLAFPSKLVSETVRMHKVIAVTV